MTDLELIKLAAEAMDLHFGDLPHQKNVPAEYEGPRITYDPLHDDAQAMALVKIFRLIIEPDGTCAECDYWAASWVNASNRKGSRSVAVRKAISINHAIVECVAKMQETK